jgi:hypothetical protein
VCFIPIVKQSLIHWFWLGFVPFTWSGIRLTTGVTGRQGMLTLHRHLTPPLVNPKTHVCPIFKYVFRTGLTCMILMNVRYLCNFTYAQHAGAIILKRYALYLKKKKFIFYTGLVDVREKKCNFFLAKICTQKKFRNHITKEF